MSTIESLVAMLRRASEECEQLRNRAAHLNEAVESEQVRCKRLRRELDAEHRKAVQDDAGTGEVSGPPPRPDHPEAGAFKQCPVCQHTIGADEKFCPACDFRPTVFHGWGPSVRCMLCGGFGGLHHAWCTNEPLMPRPGGTLHYTPPPPKEPRVESMHDQEVKFSFDGLFKQGAKREAKPSAPSDGSTPEHPVDADRDGGDAGGGHRVDAMAEVTDALRVVLITASGSTDGNARGAFDRFAKAAQHLWPWFRCLPSLLRHVVYDRNSAERARDGDGEGMFYDEDRGIGYRPAAGEPVQWVRAERGPSQMELEAIATADKYRAIALNAWKRTGGILTQDDPAHLWTDRLESLLRVLTDHYLDQSPTWEPVDGMRVEERPLRTDGLLKLGPEEAPEVEGECGSRKWRVRWNDAGVCVSNRWSTYEHTADLLEHVRPARRLMTPSLTLSEAEEHLRQAEAYATRMCGEEDDKPCGDPKGTRRT